MVEATSIEVLTLALEGYEVVEFKLALTQGEFNMIKKVMDKHLESNHIVKSMENLQVSEEIKSEFVEKSCKTLDIRPLQINEVDLFRKFLACLNNKTKDNYKVLQSRIQSKEVIERLKVALSELSLL